MSQTSKIITSIFSYFKSVLFENTKTIIFSNNNKMATATREDVEIVTHVLNNKEDYYSILKITKTATEEEVKKAYKKLALRLHPDKNKHAKAEEAFKHVSAAHTTLCDQEKRRVYDRHGTAGVQAHESGANPAARAGGQQQFYRGGGGFEQDLFEEIFSMFMDPRMNRRRQQQQYQQYQYQQQARAQQQRQQRQQPGAGGGVHMEFGGNPLLAFAPLLLFFIFALLLQSSSIFDSGHQGSSHAATSNSGGGWGASRRAEQEKNFRRSLFSLARTAEHPHERVTTQLPDGMSDLQIPYFVANHFEPTLNRYGQRLRNIELEVAKSKKESLERRCTTDVKRGTHHGRSQACRDLEKFRNVK